MKKGLLIVNGFIINKIDRFNALYEDLEKSFLEQDITLDRMTNDEALILINEKKKYDYDFILFWDKDINLAYHLENLGYLVFNNAKAIEICDDKAKTALCLENKGIKMPKTIISPFTFNNNPYSNYNLLFIDHIIEELNLPLVIKEANGSFGEQVYLAKSKEEVIDLSLKLSPKTIVYQEFIKSSAGHDVRIEVVGGEVLGAVERTNQDGDFRSNVLQGGKMEKISLDQSFYDMARDVANIIGLDFAGVDILFGENGEPILCEVNSNVHFKTFEKTTGVSLSRALALYIKKKLFK